MKHSLDIRVYYEDTDAGGVVYHANYLNFGERGRTEYLRAIGHQNSELAQDFNIIFVVKNVDIDYKKPAILDDVLRLETSIENVKNTSFVMRQTFYRDEELIADMNVVIVSVDSEVIKPVALPKAIKDEFVKLKESS